MHTSAPQHGTSSDLRIADLPEDLRPEAERLKAEYHALAKQAGLLNEQGEFETGKLDDFAFVERADLEALSRLAAAGDALAELADPLLQDYRDLPLPIQEACPFDEFRLPAFAAAAAAHGFSPYQWAGVRTVARQNGCGTGRWEPVGTRGLLLSGYVGFINLPLLTALPADMRVDGNLDLSYCRALASLPPGLSVHGMLDLTGTAVSELPADLSVGGNLVLRACPELRTLPAGIQIHRLYASQCPKLVALPHGLHVEQNLHLVECASLAQLPQGLALRGSLSVEECTALTALPDDLSVGHDLVLTGCSSLASLPTNLNVPNNLDLRDCSSLASLPLGLRVGGTMLITGCSDDVFWQARALQAMGLVGQIMS